MEILDAIDSLFVRPDGLLMASGSSLYILNSTGSVINSFLKFAALAVFSDSSMLVIDGPVVARLGGSKRVLFNKGNRYKVMYNGCILHMISQQVRLLMVTLLYTCLITSFRVEYLMLWH